MNKKRYFISICFIIVFILIIGTIFNSKTGVKSRLNATILSVNKDSLIVQDKNNVIYEFNKKEVGLSVGDRVILEYSGLLDKNKRYQNGEVISLEKDTNERKLDIPSNYDDNGLFKTYYILAYNKLKELSLDEKIGQLLLVRYSNNALKDLEKYKFSGFIFFEKDFKNKTKEEIIEEIEILQKNSKIPLLTAVDEEGGEVVRISSNPNIRDFKFKSPKELYNEGGFALISKDTKEKSILLDSLGLNVNLAPVVDVSTDPNDYIYSRTIGENTSITSEYAKTVIESSKKLPVSYTLKHFPGYGNNLNTHEAPSIDSRTYDEILNNDIPPFEAGINAGAESILVSHNIVSSIDPNAPASLSGSIHNILRNELGFTGIIMTDDIDMASTDTIDDVAVKAILAGNDLIITTSYEKSYNEIKNALDNKIISEDYINKLAFRVLAWKYYKGLMIENIK